MAAIEVEDLFKSYGAVDAVRGISLRIEEGEVFALLGPNGEVTTLQLRDLIEGELRSDLPCPCKGTHS
jgi:ABC-type Na+ transport system ATPase subunit NatA